MQNVGPYVIERELARGGQGVVLRGRDGRDGRAVAIKVLLDASDDVAERRFEREARALSLVSHPSLVRVLDHGVHQGRPYLVMELVEGEDLGTLVARGGPMPALRAVRMLAPVARAVEACHARGIVHRDVKPQNILVERGTERPVLVDFGLVRRDPNRASLGGGSVRLSLTGEVLGTPSFMSPEQADGGMAFGAVGAPADVYALGATLYALLTGRPPFSGASAIAVLQSVMTQAPASARSLVPTIPRELDALCSRALAKRPEERPQIAELAAALEGFHRGHPSGRVEVAMPSAAPAPRRSPRLLAPGAIVMAGGLLLVAAAVVARRLELTRVVEPAPPPTATLPEMPWPAAEAGWRRVWRRGEGRATPTTPSLWTDSDTVAPLAAVARGDRAALAAAFAGSAELRAEGRVAVRYGADALRARVDACRFLTAPTAATHPVVTGEGDLLRLDAPNDFGVVVVAVGDAVWAAPCTRMRVREVAPVDLRAFSVHYSLSNGRWIGLGVLGRRGVLQTQGISLAHNAEVKFTVPDTLTSLAFDPWGPRGERVRIAGETDAVLDALEGWDAPACDVSIALSLGEVDLELAGFEVEGTPRRVDRPALVRLALAETAPSLRVAGAFEREASTAAGPVLAVGEASVELVGDRLILKSSGEVVAITHVPAPPGAGGWLLLGRRPGLLWAEVEVAGTRRAVMAADPFDTPGTPGWGSSGPRVKWTEVEVLRGPDAAPSAEVVAWRAAAREVARLSCPRRCDPALSSPARATDRVLLATGAAAALDRAAPALAPLPVRIDARARALLGWILAGDTPAALRALGALRTDAGDGALAAVDGLVRDANGVPLLAAQLTAGWSPVDRRTEWAVRGAVLAVLWELAPAKRGEVAQNQGIDHREAGRFAQALEAFERAKQNGAAPESTAADEGQCLYQLGRLAEALAAYDRAVAAEPHQYWNWMGRARTLDGLGRRDDAIESALGVLATAPGLRGARSMLDELLKGASSSSRTVLARKLLGGGGPALEAEARRLRPLAEGRDADLLAYVLGEAPPPGERLTRLLALARAGDADARRRLTREKDADPLIRHVVALDPDLLRP